VDVVSIAIAIGGSVARRERARHSCTIASTIASTTTFVITGPALAPLYAADGGLPLPGAAFAGGAMSVAGGAVSVAGDG
jgi:hypothetical protein